MHKVIASYLNQFSRENSIEDLDEAKRFERFVNHLILTFHFPDSFDIEEVTTSEDDGSIDGAGVLIGDELAISEEDADSIFGRLRPRQQVSVTYVFIQAKRTEGFDAGEIHKFGSGVQMLFTNEARRITDDVLSEILKIHEKVVSNLARVNNGRPTCRLYFATTGTWNEGSGLRERLDLISEQILNTGL
ncbi:MAG: hypothetical protein JRC92_00005, partial [Deltaproteobacteria bacterium]|nr:hypothetical protein [Deltaproteobacteria bacterium]